MEQKDKSERDDPMTDVDFSGLILGFSSAALYYIGESDVEGKKVGEKNIPLAKQNIRIVEMLKDKTKGNLTKDEQDLVDSVLKDLHFKYNTAVVSH
ncbi:MAG: DUF1844 domain-containing protein [Deltaproteobacteria bacterium]|nr:DUF1844 domain-containing protein [Deltaproteobacteria bacterium]